MPSFFTKNVLVCIIVGVLGGVVCLALGLATFVTGPVLGGLYGLLFAWLSTSRAVSPGAGLLWGLGYALLLWLVGPAGLFPFLSGAMPEMGMLDAARAHFPELFAYLFCFGVPLGLATGIRGSLRPQPGLAPFNWPRALVVGGLAGIVGGWAFGKWMEQVGFFPLIAGLVNSNSQMVGSDVTLHLCHHHWSQLWAVVPAGCARLRFQPELGVGLWPVLVVPGAADDYAPLARQPS